LELFTSQVISSSNLFVDLLQFAGGFDAESMKAFEELRSKMTTQTPAPQISEA
jgi:hypothetical protein